MKLPQVARATAMVMFHRFYAKHSFAEHDRFEVAVACVLLAAKTEESPRKLNVVIQECHRLKNRGMAMSGGPGGKGMGGAGGGSPGPSASPASASSSGGGGGSGGGALLLDTKCEEFMKLKERILLLERVILHTIGFELSIDHPYKFLVEVIKKLNQTRQLEYAVLPKGSSGASASQMQGKMMNELVQYAMNFANDSMHTTLCLQFPARLVAEGCVYLSGQFCKIRPTGGRTWMEVLGGGGDVEALASVSVQIMELIADKKGGDLEVFRMVRRDLDKMREAEERKERSGAGGKQGAVASASSSGGGGRDAKRPRVG